MTATPDRAATSATPPAGVAARPTPATAAPRAAAVAGQGRGPSVPDVQTAPVPTLHTEGPRSKRRNKSGEIGAKTESAVVRYLQANGWPTAERRRLKGAHDEGDITGCPGLVFEIKGGKAARTASDALIGDWLDETETERQNAAADVGILVIHRPGIGLANAGRWWAVMRFVAVHCLHTGNDDHVQPETWDVVDAMPLWMTLADAVRLLRREGGYGTPEVTP